MSHRCHHWNKSVQGGGSVPKCLQSPGPWSPEWFELCASEDRQGEGLTAQLCAGLSGTQCPSTAAVGLVDASLMVRVLWPPAAAHRQTIPTLQVPVFFFLLHLTPQLPLSWSSPKLAHLWLSQACAGGEGRQPS